MPKPGDPQSLNRYAYVNNNPLRYNDPTGHCPWCIAVGIGALIGAGVSYGVQVAANISQNGLNVQAFTNVNWKQVGAGAVAGAVGGATFGLGTAALGTGLAGTVGAGAISGATAGQAAIATDNVLSGQAITEGLGKPEDVLRDAAVGGFTAGIGYGASRLFSPGAADPLLEASAWQEAEEVVGARLGVQKNTTRYLEEGMSRRRIPDFVTKHGVYEVKYYSRTTLYATTQLRDEAVLARHLGKPFYVVVRQGTNVHPWVFKLTKQTGGDVLRWLK